MIEFYVCSVPISIPLPMSTILHHYLPLSLPSPLPLGPFSFQALWSTILLRVGHHIHPFASFQHLLSSSRMLTSLHHCCNLAHPWMLQPYTTPLSEFVDLWLIWRPDPFYLKPPEGEMCHDLVLPLVDRPNHRTGRGMMSNQACLPKEINGNRCDLRWPEVHSGQGIFTPLYYWCYLSPTV